jgi:isoleucyl-tRNA synthetase
MDYSKTLNLPKTDFPMKANLSQREPEIQRLWAEIDLYGLMQKRESPLGKFVLHDGPPYSNGDVHLGLAANKILKDIVVRYRCMEGYKTPFVPGWDSHGMPIENIVSKEFRAKGATPGRMDIRRRCREYAAHYIDVQREQFKRLGCLGNWDDPYVTMSKDFEAQVVKVFGELALAGFIYRGLKPIHWCPVCETALAEAEIVYGETTSPSIWVRFELSQDPNGVFEKHDPKRSYALIWTTTPWTIPANLAVALNPDLDYVVVEHDGDRYLLAGSLLDATMRKCGFDSYEVKKTIKGSDALGLRFRHPLFERDVPALNADFVLADEGTGVVHIAPGHGAEDFYLGQQSGLGVLSPVDEKGHFTSEAGQFEGLFVEGEGSEAVMRVLTETGHQLAQAELHHQYPRCWRCDSPLIFRAAVQWFMNIDHEGHRRKCLDAIPSVEWFPKESIRRITAMVEGRPDWCLSRQRAWGVGIPAFFCSACGEPLLTKESLDSVYRLVAERGADAWFEVDSGEILGDGEACAKCGGFQFTKETDILDVWFDSGSTCRIVLESRPELGYPCDLYLEGSDQHRGWFNAALMVGMGTKNEPPYHQVITHGWMLDADGKAMHKSAGNVVSPQEVTGAYGADVLRLWVSSCDYFEDMRYSDETARHVVDVYRRIRNTFRFLLGNLYDRDPGWAPASPGDLREVDRWVLSRLQGLVAQVRGAYDTYEFHRMYRAIHNFCSVELSSFYLDVSKDTLYADGADSATRRSAQYAMSRLLSALVRMVAPVTCHTADEVWGAMRGLAGWSDLPESVALAEFPTVEEEFVDTALEERWGVMMGLRDEVYRRIEDARQAKAISQPMAAAVELKVPEAVLQPLSAISGDLAELLVVSSVEIGRSEQGAVEVAVSPAQVPKCERCWRYLASVGSEAEHQTLCERCASVV